MKKFILNRIVSETLSALSIIEMITNNKYDIEAFKSHENKRSGFTSIHPKLENLYLNSNDYVFSKFKTATRKINKTIVEDLVKARIADAKEKGEDHNPKLIEEAVISKLRPTSDIAFSTFDVLFDLKNGLLYCSGTANQLDDFIKETLKGFDSSIQTRPLTPEYKASNMSLFFKQDSILPKNIKLGSSADIDINGEKFTFKNVELFNNKDVESITGNYQFNVENVQLVLYEKDWNCIFKLNKKGFPNGISLYVTESTTEEKEGGTDLSKEEELYDKLYANSFIEYETLTLIASFAYNLDSYDAEDKK